MTVKTSTRTLLGSSGLVGNDTNPVAYTIASQITIPADTILDIDDFVDVEAWGYCTTQTPTTDKDIELAVGGGQVLVATLDSVGGDWHLRARFFFSSGGQAPQRCMAEIVQNGGHTFVQTGAPTFDWGSANDMLLMIRSTNGVANQIQVVRVAVYGEKNA